MLVLSHYANAAILHGPIQWLSADGGNNHYYAIVGSEDITWTDARDDSASWSHLGSIGHLVTITSEAESDFLDSTFSSFVGDPNGPGGIFPFVPGIRAWIGLSDAANEGNYEWVTGEPFGFSDWAPPEPNDLDGEDYVHLWRRDFGSGPQWSWNDSGNFAGPIDGYIAEFDGPFLQPVPEPSSFILLSSGVVLATIVSRLRRRTARRAGQSFHREGE